MFNYSKYSFRITTFINNKFKASGDNEAYSNKIVILFEFEINIFLK